MAICDGFVYIPQYGPGTASLNVAVAASIILHRFATWAGYRERTRDGTKCAARSLASLPPCFRPRCGWNACILHGPSLRRFVVAERPMRTTPRGRVSDDPEELRARRAAARAALDGGGADDWGGADSLLEEELGRIAGGEADAAAGAGPSQW